LGLGVCLSLALAGCQRDPPEPQADWVPVRVQAVGPAGVASAAEGMRYSANVTPNAQVDVSFKVNGYIARILQVRGADGRMRDVQQGDTVEKGTVLAKVRDQEYTDKVTTATANLGKAKASLDKATEDFKRATALIATQSITQPDYDSAKREYDTAQSAVMGAKAQLDESRLTLTYTDLVAPMRGVLLSRKIEVGALVGPGTVGFVMADLSSAKVVFSVPDVMLGQVPMGKTVAITTESIPGKTFSGKITAVAAAADTKTRVFEIEVSIPNQGGDLKDGMVAALSLAGGADAATAAAQAVPLQAVVRPKGDPSGYAVFVIADANGKQVARLRPVQLGQVLGDHIAVLSGLARGERVIVVGATTVADGTVVRITP
jgi:RND family efflux transporter MFP subunit